MDSVELRKDEERQFHNFVRSKALKTNSFLTRRYLLNYKYYLASRASWNLTKQIIKEKCKGQKVLDYCCGNGCHSFFIAKNGAKEVCGIDISGVSIELCKKTAIERGIADRINFIVMDAEKMEFPDNSFDMIFISGALHHLDINRAYCEMARVLRPGGEAICIEALGHNPLINAYRKMSPHLRTDWEMRHILRKKDIELAWHYFKDVKILGFFHLAVLMAAPFSSNLLFSPLLNILEKLDNILLRLPLLKWQAWQVVFLLTK